MTSESLFLCRASTQTFARSMMGSKYTLSPGYESLRVISVHSPNTPMCAVIGSSLCCARVCGIAAVG